MSQNFNPQPTFPITPLSSSTSPPQAPQPNTGGSYLETATKAFYDGAVTFAAGTLVRDNLANSITGSAARGVVSFWIRWEPSERTTSGWPRLGQPGVFSVSPYFGTDPAYTSMGSIQVQLVALPEVAVEFAPGAT